MAFASEDAQVLSQLLPSDQHSNLAFVLRCGVCVCVCAHVRMYFVIVVNVINNYKALVRKGALRVNTTH